MKKNSANELAVIAIFFASMVVINYLSSILFQVLPVPIKPTIVHIPVIIASIVYGPRIGAILGGLMGLISVTHNTLILSPFSYLFSPFVENGSLSSLVIAIVPRILIGVTPYLLYRIWKGRPGLFVAGAIGSLTNTLFVLGGIFFLFQHVYAGDINALLAAVFSQNALAEMIISSFLTAAIVPSLLKVKK